MRPEQERNGENMFDIVVCSNDSRFLDVFSKELTGKLSQYAPQAVRVRSISLIQTSLYDVDTPPDLYIVELGDEPERAMEFIERLRLSAKTAVMVIAPGPDWAMRAYNAEVMFYLLSPPDLDRVAELILRRLALRADAKGTGTAGSGPANLFSFRAASGTQVVSVDRIVYIEYSDHRLLIYLDNGKRLSTTTMRLSFGDATAQLLRDPRFVRTHASFLVNITHVSQFGHYALTMDTGATVPVSHAKKADVKRQFTEFFQ